MNKRNMNRLTALVNNQQRLAAKLSEAEAFEAVLKYDLTGLVTAPLTVAVSLQEFMPYLGMMASISNKALTRQENAYKAYVWRRDTPDAEKVNENAPKVEFQPFVTWTSEGDISEEDREAGALSDDELSDNGMETKRNYHDERTGPEIADAYQLCRSAVHSIANVRGVKEVSWLNGTFKQTMVIDGDGKARRVTVPHIPCAYESIHDKNIRAMAMNQHRDSLWYTKQLYFHMTEPGLDLGYHKGEIHEIKELFAKHLEEEIIVEEEITTRLQLIVTDIANHKFAQFIEKAKQGLCGSADMVMWIAYSTDRVKFAERLLDSLEMEEYLQAEEEAAAKLREREERMARFNRVKAGAASPVDIATVMAEQAKQPHNEVAPVKGMAPNVYDGRTPHMSH